MTSFPLYECVVYMQAGATWVGLDLCECLCHVSPRPPPRPPPPISHAPDPLGLPAVQVTWVPVGLRDEVGQGVTADCRH